MLLEATEIRNVVTSTRELQIRRTSVTSSRTTQRTSVTSRPRPPRDIYVVFA